MINVLNEGLKGMNMSAREMQQSAQEIARFNVREEAPQQSVNPLDQALPPVEGSAESGSVQNIAEPLVELKRQELLFTASASVVKVADQTLGSLLDIKG